MRVRFWSDTNQAGFADALEAMGVSLDPVNTYDYEIPQEMAELAADWGATEIQDDEK